MPGINTGPKSDLTLSVNRARGLGFHAAKEYTWAGKPSAGNAGAQIIVTDVGVNSWARFRDDGAVWRLLQPTDLAVSLTASAGTTGTAEQILKQWTAPAGLLASLRYLQIKCLWTDNGTTASDNVSMRVRCGPLGTTADPAIIANTTTFVATNRSWPTITSFFAPTNTVLRALAAPGLVTEFSGTVSTLVSPVDIAVSDVTASAMIFSLSAQMAIGTDAPTLQHLIITGH